MENLTTEAFYLYRETHPGGTSTKAFEIWLKEGGKDKDGYKPSVEVIRKWEKWLEERRKKKPKKKTVKHKKQKEQITRAIDNK